jgi:LmbE family N-acetylglucosaminyl deacetylase
MTEHCYLSPHLDDAVFSCGGLIAKQVSAGESVAVFTICAGDPPEGPLSDLAQALHLAWQTEGSPIAARRKEDLTALQHLGASAIHLPLPDAIYRSGMSSEHHYPTFTQIFGPLHSEESQLLEELIQNLASQLPADAAIYAPMAIGEHVDHRLTRMAAERLDRPLRYYQDLPYAFRDGKPAPELGIPSGIERLHMLSQENIDAWAGAILDYPSQVPSFWESEAEVRSELQTICSLRKGLVLIEK